MQIEWLDVNPNDDIFEMGEGDQILQIDWHHNDFTQNRRVLGVWIARPVGASVSGVEE